MLKCYKTFTLTLKICVLGPGIEQIIPKSKLSLLLSCMFIGIAGQMFSVV